MLAHVNTENHVDASSILEERLMLVTMRHERKIRYNVSYLEAWETQPTISKCSIQTEELNTPGKKWKIWEKKDGRKGILVNTHIFKWVYTRIVGDSKGEKEMIDESLVNSPNKTDAVYLHKRKIINMLWNYLRHLQVRGTLK